MLDARHVQGASALETRAHGQRGHLGSGHACAQNTFPDITNWLVAHGDVKIATIICDDDIVPVNQDAATMLPTAPNSEGCRNLEQIAWTQQI